MALLAGRDTFPPIRGARTCAYGIAQTEAVIGNNWKPEPVCKNPFKRFFDFIANCWGPSANRMSSRTIERINYSARSSSRPEALKSLPNISNTDRRTYEKHRNDITDFFTTMRGLVGKNVTLMSAIHALKMSEEDFDKPNFNLTTSVRALKTIYDICQKGNPYPHAGSEDRACDALIALLAMCNKYGLKIGQENENYIKKLSWFGIFITKISNFFKRNNNFQVKSDFPEQSANDLSTRATDSPKYKYMRNKILAYVKASGKITSEERLRLQRYEKEGDLGKALVILTLLYAHCEVRGGLEQIENKARYALINLLSMCNARSVKVDVKIGTCIQRLRTGERIDVGIITYINSAGLLPIRPQPPTYINSLSFGIVIAGSPPMQASPPRIDPSSSIPVSTGPLYPSNSSSSGFRMDTSPSFSTRSSEVSATPHSHSHLHISITNNRLEQQTQPTTVETSLEHHTAKTEAAKIPDSVAQEPQTAKIDEEPEPLFSMEKFNDSVETMKKNFSAPVKFPKKRKLQEPKTAKTETRFSMSRPISPTIKKVNVNYYGKHAQAQDTSIKL
jgi:hypothetical protein